MEMTINEYKEKLKQLDRAFIGAVSSALNYDSKEWVFNDNGRLHAVATNFLNGTENHENGSITLALAKYQSSYFEPVPLNIRSDVRFKTKEGEQIYYEYNKKTGSFFVPSKQQLLERNSKYFNDVAATVENTHFNASLYASTRGNKNTDPKETLHLVFRGTEKDLDNVVKKYGFDAYTDLDKYYRQMEVFEKAIFKYLEENPQIKEFSVTGHSLGGAMAQFFHEKHRDYFESKGIKFYATTFGSPGADMKPWFSKFKERFRTLRENINSYVLVSATMADYREENATNTLNKSLDKYQMADNFLDKSKSFFSLAVAVTANAVTRIDASIKNYLKEKFTYYRVKEENLFRNNDSAEVKNNYDQHHYFHKNDPIPKVGSLGYNRNGKKFLLFNHLREERGAGKYFKSIMGEHSSDAYIHNIVNEITNIYNQNPHLKPQMFALNPAYREYMDGYVSINEKKNVYQQIIKTHPEMKELLAENIFKGAHHKSTRTMASSVSNYNKSKEYTLNLLIGLSNSVNSYIKNIEPIFSNKSPLINGKAVISDYSDGILPIPKGHVIAPIPQVIKNEYQSTLIIEPTIHFSPSLTQHEFIGEKSEIKSPKFSESNNNKISNTKLLLDNFTIEHPTSKLLHTTVACTCNSNTVAMVEKCVASQIKLYSAKGKIDNFLFSNDKGSCDLQPDVNISQYNVHAIQSFHADYSTVEQSKFKQISQKISEKLGLSKPKEIPRIDTILTDVKHISEHGATKHQIEELGKSLESFLNKPEVMANIKQVVKSREESMISELQQKNTRQIKIT